MCSIDEVLEATADPEKLSFFGMDHWLNEAGRLVESLDGLLLAKKRSPEEDRKDELVEAQKRLRNSMGALVKTVSLTKKERPLAEMFLKHQIAKIEKAPKQTGAAAEKATAAVEKLKQLLEDVSKSKPAPDTREVQEIEESMKTADAEWKEVSPIYKKWESGKHSFKSNADLQAMQRRYRECQKIREMGPDRLLKALCSSREGKAVALPQEQALPKGWSAVAKTAPKAATVSRAKQAPRRAPAANAWGSAAISFAQRLRAQASAQVREEARTIEEEEDEDDNEEDDRGAIDDESEAAPAVAGSSHVRPKPPPPLPASAQSFTPVKGSSKTKTLPSPVPKAAPTSDDEEEEEEIATASRPKGYSASAKKKGNSKKKKGGGRDEFDVTEPSEQSPAPPSSKAWVSTAEAALEGSVLKDLLRSNSWTLAENEDIGNDRLQSLTERLEWVNPLGLALPMEWKQFLSLEVDGGPARTSKRGTAPWITRVGKNVPLLLGHYVTIMFLLALLQELSYFGLPMWALLLQAGLILAPPLTSPYLQSPTRVLLLQAAHLLLWLLFIRSLWQMHFFVKVLCMLLVGCHAYVVAPVADS